MIHATSMGANLVSAIDKSSSPLRSRWQPSAVQHPRLRMGHDGQLGDLVLWSVYCQPVPYWRFTKLVLDGQAEVGQLA
jgi:hypothetical protein